MTKVVLLHLSIVTCTEECQSSHRIKLESSEGRGDRHFGERIEAYLGAEVKEVHDAVLKLSDAEGEAVDLARVLHQGLSLLISEHVVSFVWFSCHLEFKD